MGPVVDTLTMFVERTVEIELNSSNDNPLIVVEEGDAVHNANFHGQYIANAMDQLAIVLVNMCNLSDRRNNRLLHPEPQRRPAAVPVPREPPRHASRA